MSLFRLTVDIMVIIDAQAAFIFMRIHADIHILFLATYFDTSYYYHMQALS